MDRDMGTHGQQDRQELTDSPSLHVCVVWIVSLVDAFHMELRKSVLGPAAPPFHTRRVMRRMNPRTGNTNMTQSKTMAP